MPPIVRKPEQRRERLAVNLFDLDRIDPLIRGQLLSGKLDLSSAVQTDKGRADEMAVVFTCDLLTAATVCDVIRDHDREVGDYPTRVYVNRATAWSRLTGETILTRVMNQKVELSPDAFTIQQPVAPVVPMRPGRVSLRNP